MNATPPKYPLVRHRDETDPIDCPFGQVQRVVTGGDGGVSNVHVVSVTKGLPHRHEAYDETYFVLRGTGTIRIAEDPRPLRPGSVAVIPAGVVHSLDADPGETLEFVIFGTPPLPLDDLRAAPQSD